MSEENERRSVSRYTKFHLLVVLVVIIAAGIGMAAILILPPPN